MKPKRPRPYTNQLLTDPIDKDIYFRRGTIADGEDFEAEQAKQFAKLFVTKLAALYRHYKIDQDKPESAHDLVLELAKAHVPGFQIKSLKDPREYWNSDRLMWLDATFQKLRPQFDTDMAAYQHISESGLFKSGNENPKASTIKNVHYRYASRAENNPWLGFIELLRQKGLSEEIISEYIQKMSLKLVKTKD